jgi:hypothetical protein
LVIWRSRSRHLIGDSRAELGSTVANECCETPGLGSVVVGCPHGEVAQSFDLGRLDGTIKVDPQAAATPFRDVTHYLELIG